MVGPNVAGRIDPFGSSDLIESRVMRGSCLGCVQQAVAKMGSTVRIVNSAIVDLTLDERGVQNTNTGEILPGIPGDFAAPDEPVSVTVVGKPGDKSSIQFWACYDALAQQAENKLTGSA
jgi:hypothetical protein